MTLSPLILEVLLIILVILAIVVCILSIIILLRLLSAAKRIDSFFEYLDRIQAIAEAFEGIPRMLIGAVKELISEYISPIGKKSVSSEKKSAK